MIRSVLKLSTDDFKRIVSLLPDKNEKDKVRILNYEREMLEELMEVLSFFEQFTDELQADTITISKVWPCVAGLKVYL